MRIRGQTQCCSLNNFWCPVELLIQYLISFSRGVLLASSFDHAWITPSFRARVNRARDFGHNFCPPSFKPLWGEWLRRQGVFGARY